MYFKILGDVHQNYIKPEAHALYYQHIAINFNSFIKGYNVFNGKLQLHFLT